MNEERRKKVLKACIKMKTYDDEEELHIWMAVRCPLDKHDHLQLKVD